MTNEVVRGGKHRPSSFSLRRLFQNYSLSIVLAALFLLSWFLHGVTGWKAFVSEQKEHGAGVNLWGDDGYIWEFLKQTLENWQSEFLQLLSMVVLTASLIHKGSAESRDSTDRMERKIDEIKRAVEKLKSVMAALATMLTHKSRSHVVRAPSNDPCLELQRPLSRFNRNFFLNTAV